MANISEYYLGLDMGISSVGWAVTDGEYHILRAKGKDLWGIREFDEADSPPNAGQTAFQDGADKEKRPESAFLSACFMRKYKRRIRIFSRGLTTANTIWRTKMKL